MGVISRLYTFVNGSKAMAQQVNAEFDQLVNAHNSNEGVIATIQGKISTELATKEELADVMLGLIPDDTITQQKLAPALREALPAQYVRNRIPTSADNYAAGHKIGDAWYIPDITLNNLIPTPLAVSPADFIIQNANSAASGSAITLTCQSGFEYALLRRTITPVAGALYCLFASLKLTSDHVLTSIALNYQVITSPVKNTTYNVACVVAEPTQFEVKALAADGAALNGATVVVDKLTIVNMTADMDGVPFDKAGAEAYFQANPAFLTHKLNNAKTRWYCSDNGVWQSSSQLMDETKDLYGVENVDAALLALTTAKYLAFYGFGSMVQNNSLGDALFSSNGSFPDARMLVYDNLTINAGVTVTPSRAKNQMIFVKDTLTLNGTISVKDKGGAGGQATYTVNNPGAKGAGAIIIFASKIVGAGVIQAGGTDAINSSGNPSSSYDGFAGGAGFMFNAAVAAGAQAVFGGPGAGGAASVNAKLPSGGFYLSQISVDDFGAGGGGGGSCSNSGSYQGAGAGGGGGAFGAGGAGGGTPKGAGVGGGGGGGGGLIVLVSSFGVPGISLIAKGGKGGNGSSTTGGGGGGGGGGQVIIVAPSSTAIVDVSGGVGGSPTGTASSGATGGAGLSMLL